MYIIKVFYEIGGGGREVGTRTGWDSPSESVKDFEF